MLRGGLPMARPLSERALVALIALVQFVNIVDFMMVMPLGPDFARALGIDPSNIGLLGGAYTLAAAATGIAGARWFDGYDRRVVLTWSLVGLGIGTLAAALASSLTGLLVARVLAGAFGGPATAIASAIVADAVPVERRGRALAVVMGAFPFAAVLGVPLGLELARLGNWQTPFIVLGLLILATAAFTHWRLPPQRGHLDTAAVPGALRDLMWSPLGQAAFLVMALTMFGRFLVVPNLSAWLQFNLEVPRADISLLYLVGGVASFVAMRFAGWAVDRHGAVRVAWLACAMLVVVLVGGFLPEPPWLSPLVMFSLFMMAAAASGVANTTTISKVPGPQQRAGFMAGISACQHLACSAGALLSAAMLSATPDGALVGMTAVVVLALLLALLQPWLLDRVERLRG